MRQTEAMVRAVVFDLGQVLASGEGIISEPAAFLDVAPDRFEELYWADRAAYDAGATDAEYWGPILSALDKPATPETIAHLAALDADLWLRMRPTAHQLLVDVRAAGRTVAILSNAPFTIDIGLLGADFADDADFWFISASMGVTKPNSAAYWRVTEVLDLHPSTIAFIDDRPENVAGAERIGWKAHLWQSDADSRVWLSSQGVLEPS
ncbi:MAG: HAD-IA family hydrolase [Propioniciclava sp.]